MTNPYHRLATVARVLARPVAIALARECNKPQTLAALAERFNRSESSVRVTVAELLSAGIITKPEGCYLSRALEAGEMENRLPALLRALAEELEGVA